ncbi:hypothetical protein DPEC_G00358980 [Dallia pectoralis]|uniref:Uncharacterized protein n=1 Tax=Dallia pectoralis TaxID=75939 RepID=A0ACC2F0I8_DALPE|nr:hypothetical protein DPEC_G00358980 [Dallia pectoralis]
MNPEEDPFGFSVGHLSADHFAGGCASGLERVQVGPRGVGGPINAPGGREGFVSGRSTFTVGQRKTTARGRVVRRPAATGDRAASVMVTPGLTKPFEPPRGDTQDNQRLHPTRVRESLNHC